MNLARRGFLAGLAVLAAPAIIRTPGLLMPVKVLAVAPELPLRIIGLSPELAECLSEFNRVNHEWRALQPPGPVGSFLTTNGLLTRIAPELPPVAKPLPVVLVPEDIMRRSIALDARRRELEERIAVLVRTT